MRNLRPLHEDYYSNYKITEINKEARLQYKIDEKNAKIDTSLRRISIYQKYRRNIDSDDRNNANSSQNSRTKDQRSTIVIKKLQEANLDTIAKEISNKIRRLSYAGFKLAANLSNMSQFAMQFTNSFGDISSKIRRRTY